MKLFALILLGATAVFAQVSGTVINGGTGKPQANQTVSLYKFGQGGMEPVASVKTDTAGKFAFDQAPSSQGPSMVRAEVDDVIYNKLMPPGTPTTGLELTVYNASKQKPAAVKISKHMILFEPANGQMIVNETYLVDNGGRTTWSDPANGTLRFFLPGAANGQVEVKGSAPDGMPVTVPTDKTARPEIYAAKFEVKPGQTRFDLTYTVPYTIGSPYRGKIVNEEDNTYLIAPNGITMKADHVTDLGTEPRTQAHIYGLQSHSYDIQLSGAEIAPPADNSAGGDSSSQSDGGPQIEVIPARIYSEAKPILATAVGILGLGFALLYRREAK